jgi:hypothetical protein
VEVFREIKWLDLVDKLLKQVTESLDFFLAGLYLFKDYCYIYYINLKTNKMKKLFCAVVSDPDDVYGLVSPIIYHIKGNNSTQVEDAVREMLEDEYDYEPKWIEQLDIFTFEVTDVEIIELDTL